MSESKDKERKDIGESTIDTDTVIDIDIDTKVADEDAKSTTDSPSKSYDYSGRGFSGFEDTYKDLIHIDSRVIEVHEKWVKLDCLVDRNNNIFEERIFHRHDFQDPDDIRPGDFILIRKFWKPGKIVFTFNKGEKLINKEPFEDVSMFEDLDKYDFSKNINE